MNTAYRFCKSPVDFLCDMTENNMNIIQGYAVPSLNEEGELFISIDIYSNKPLDQDLLRVSGAGFGRLLIHSEKLCDDQYRVTYSTRPESSTGMIIFTLSHLESRESLNLSWHDGTITDPQGYEARIENGNLVEVISEEEIEIRDRIKTLFKNMSDRDGNKDTTWRLEILDEIASLTRELENLRLRQGH